MNVDLFTASLFTALVGNVAGAVFIIDTILRRDHGPGRIWSIAFLCGMATTVAYSMWAAGIGEMLPIAVGNALFVTTTAVMWLGSRSFNERRIGSATAVTVLGALTVAGAVVVEGPDGGDWAGWLTMGIGLVVFSTLAAIETLRAPMRRFGTAAVLAVVFLVMATFYLIRCVVFVVAGADSPLFLDAFGSVVANFFTVVLTVVAVVVISVLRAAQVELRSFAWMTSRGVTSDGILLAATLRTAMTDVIERARWRGELVSTVAVRVADLAEIRTAFGADVAGDVLHHWRRSVRRYAPSFALVGEDGADALVVVTRAATAAEARRQAAVIYRGVLEALGAVSRAVIPSVGVGVALTETVGYRTEVLVHSARVAADESATSVESSVLFGGLSYAEQDPA
ncbi:diguanylate cyclase [Microbacterium sp. CIAB417]|uniref:diguanylate cyclase n=1 Tax=Microbacterium sp. CIAB417 TaxID=2860287 RepID=UPI001FAE16C3|nr:diguanylate cyclase [Microbacterium sp. CIAB417]